MKFTFLFSFLFIVVSQSLFSQTKPIKDVHISLIPINNPIQPMGDSLLMDNTSTVDSLLTDFYQNSTFKVGVSVLLTDTINISKIFVKLGRTDGGVDVFDNFFLFDHSNQPHGVSFTRNKFYVVLELGDFSDVSELFCEVYTVKPNTAATSPFKTQIKNQ